MFRLSGFLCLLGAVASGALLFQTSQSVQQAEQELYQAQSYVEEEQESLRILTAEWDYLNRPERLEKLTLQNLDVDEAQAEKASFIEGNEVVPEPRVPVLPQIKPKNIFQQVSIQNKSLEKNNEPETIKNGESQNFNAMIDEAEGEKK